MKTPKYFRVLTPKNSSFYGKVGEVTSSRIYPRSSDNYGIHYTLNFALGKRPTISQKASFYDYQLKEVELLPLEKKKVKQESMF